MHGSGSSVYFRIMSDMFNLHLLSIGQFSKLPIQDSLLLCVSYYCESLTLGALNILKQDNVKFT